MKFNCLNRYNLIKSNSIWIIAKLINKIIILSVACAIENVHADSDLFFKLPRDRKYQTDARGNTIPDEIYAMMGKPLKLTLAPHGWPKDKDWNALPKIKNWTWTVFPRNEPNSQYTNGLFQFENLTTHSLFRKSSSNPIYFRDDAKCQQINIGIYKKSIEFIVSISICSDGTFGVHDVLLIDFGYDKHSLTELDDVPKSYSNKYLRSNGVRIVLLKRGWRNRCIQSKNERVELGDINGFEFHFDEFYHFYPIKDNTRPYSWLFDLCKGVK